MMTLKRYGYIKNRYGRSWLRCLAWLLAVLMLAATFTACTDEPIETSNLNFLSASGYSVYTVVYSETTATEEIVAAARDLRDTLEVILGCEVALTDDHVSAGTDYSYEILVGEVNRTVIPGIMESLDEDEYTARVMGHKIVLLGADNRATLEAVDYFMESVLYCDGVETAQPNPALSISPTYLHNAVHLIPQQALSKQNTVLPVASYLPEEMHLIALPENTCDALTLGTLQGLAATLSGEQILIDTALSQTTLDLLSQKRGDGYGVTVYRTDAQGNVWTLGGLLSYYSARLNGYILCESDLDTESVSVAISMANQLCAVVVTPENEQTAIDAGLPMVFDARTATMEWFCESEYFEQINRTLAVEQSAQLAPRLVDYAVMSGALFTTYKGEDAYLHAQTFRYLDDGAVVLGGNDRVGEYRTVQTFAALNACFIPAKQCYNLSTLSGLARDGISLAAVAGQNPGEQTKQEKHTVCLLMSDGENLDWVTDKFLTSDFWYGSEKRGTFAVNWGVPAALGELANPTLTALGTTRKPTDEFVLQLSGTGYTFPSLWQGAELSRMAEQLNGMMTDMGLSYLQVTDDGAPDLDSLAVLATQTAVKGIFYSDYGYANTDGSLLWIDDVPVVSTKYRLWAGLHEGSVSYIADAINSACVDPSDLASYSVIVVHAWSGLDAEGRLVSGGDTMDAVAALVAALDEDVEIVGAQEFMERIKANLTVSE